MGTGSWQVGPRVEGAGGVEIATWDLGGDGPPLLLLHATGFHARMWLPLAPVLGDRHRLWAVDLRGHGASGHSPTGEYHDWSLFAGDILAVVDHLGLADDPAGGLVGAGHSLGAAVLLLAEQRRPGLLRAAYCYEPIVLGPAERAEMARHDTPLSRVAAKRRAGFTSRRAARDNYASKPPFAAFAPAALDAYVEHAFIDLPDGTVELACRPAEEASVYRGAPLHDGWEHLPTTAMAVTLACGTDDSPPARILPAMAARLPRARAERFEGLTHFGPMEDPARVAGAVADALAAPGGSHQAVTPDH